VIYGTIVIDLDPNIVQIGPFLLTWHGLFSVLGILAAARLAQLLLRREGIGPDRVYDMAVWMVVLGIVGARVLYVWENYKLFAAGPPYKVLLLNEGGISQWGGIFGALLGGWIWCRRHRVPFLRVIDAAGPANAIGFLVGRIGDVINGEHHGTPTNLPWGVNYVNAATLGQPGRIVHPEVAYEMLWCAVLLAIGLPLYRRLKKEYPEGVVGLAWLGVYAAGRFLLSFMREDSLFFGLRQAQWAGLLMIVVAIAGIAYLLSRRRTAPPAEGLKVAA